MMPRCVAAFVYIVHLFCYIFAISYICCSQVYAGCCADPSLLECDNLRCVRTSECMVSTSNRCHCCTVSDIGGQTALQGAGHSITVSSQVLEYRNPRRCKFFKSGLTYYGNCCCTFNHRNLLLDGDIHPHPGPFTAIHPVGLVGNDTLLKSNVYGSLSHNATSVVETGSRIKYTEVYLLSLRYSGFAVRNFTEWARVLGIARRVRGCRAGVGDNGVKDCRICAKTNAHSLYLSS
jgi:hypothetical protein